MASGITPSTLDLSGQLVAAGSMSLTVNFVTVPEDTIAAVLHERLANVGAGSSMIAWFGLAVTTWAAYFSATFHDSLGIKANVIEAAFLLFGFLCIVMTCVMSLRYFKGRKESSVSSIVAAIVKKSSKSNS